MFVNRNHRPGGRVHRAALAVVVGLLAATALPSAQPRSPMNEAQVRALARRAQASAKGDATALVLGLDQLVRDAWGEFESFPISVVRREDLLVTLSTPYMSYRQRVIDALRTSRPIDGAAWVDTTVLSVNPARLTSPDIERVVVTRDGREVAPVAGRLRPMTFSNGSGEQGTLHAGDVHWPVSAFAPGAAVTATLHVRGGDPLVYEFSEAELTTLK